MTFPGNIGYSFTYTVAQANVWQKITKTIPGNSNITINDDNGSGLRVYVGVPAIGSDYTSGTADTWVVSSNSTKFPTVPNTWLTAGASTFELTGVQFEVGDTATTFEHRSFDTEYLRCCRYYQTTTYAQYGNTYNACGAYAGSSTSLQCANLGFKTVMRTNPTVVFINWNSGTDHTVRNSLGTNTALSSPTYYTMPHGVNAVGTSGGLSRGVWYQFNYTADAEL